VSVTYGTTFIGLIIGQVVNPVALSSIGWKHYIVFCCILAVLFVTIWFLFPETKNRSLEEIAEIFDGTTQMQGHGDAGKGAVDTQMIEDAAQFKSGKL
jgi:MFS family permease